MSRIESAPEPANLEAERAVLGSILIENEAMQLIHLEPMAFYRDAHRIIFESMQTLWGSGCHIDFTLLADELSRAGKLQDVGGYAYLTDLISAIPTAMYADHYAGIVQRYYDLRRLIAMSREGVKRAFEGGHPDELSAWYAEQLRAIQHGKQAGEGVDWEDSFPAFQDILNKKEQDLDAGVSGWPWPWDSWNGVFGHAQPGMVIYVAGATGKGKTTFAENVAEHWAKMGKRIVFVHLELNKKIMWARRAARHTGIDVRKLLNNRLSPDERDRIAYADRQMESWVGGIHYLPAPGKSSEEICRELVRLNAEDKCDAFVVDYMQKMAASPNQLKRFRGSNSDLDIQANHIDQLKDMAEQYEMRAIVLGQLTKAGNDDISFADLTLSKLRGTQEIADKVNGVALFHREIMPAGMVDGLGRRIVEPGGASRTVRIRIAKNTLGPEGAIEQYMTPETFKVSDLTTKEKP